jgi:hypothetical protein
VRGLRSLEDHGQRNQMSDERCMRSRAFPGGLQRGARRRDNVVIALADNAAAYVPSRDAAASRARANTSSVKRESCLRERRNPESEAARPHQYEGPYRRAARTRSPWSCRALALWMTSNAALAASGSESESRRKYEVPFASALGSAPPTAGLPCGHRSPDRTLRGHVERPPDYYESPAYLVCDYRSSAWPADRSVAAPAHAHRRNAQRPEACTQWFVKENRGRDDELDIAPRVASLPGSERLASYWPWLGKRTQGGRAWVNVDVRGIQMPMTQQIGDRLGFHVLAVESRSKSVPQSMGAAPGLRKSAASVRALQSLFDHALCQSLPDSASVPKKQLCRIGMRTPLSSVPSQCSYDVTGNRELSAAIGLGLRYAHARTRPINVVEL